ncbi:amino acid adenylation domain-containing protein [Micromonospora sp. KC207]|uniref:non-ribosomal peptide synthetase n=1 Tax=Micromonospora sp. KC207 TaxID=2530377 RepID=UPI001047A096|nr:non-ribosomal peptide synthetase [Micromonospora sp. KC207]TDC67110.1 amino acid adenylation domain-containing protein [Micromonospora sp. KC207]
MQPQTGTARQEATLKEKSLRVLETLVPGTPANNISFAFAVPGLLDPDAAQAALDLLVRRYQILRTVFDEADGELRKRLLETVRVMVETDEYDPQDVSATLDAYAARPFPVDGSPLLRLGLFRGPQGDIVCLVVHHLVFDTVSTSIFVEEFTQAYEALRAGAAVPGALLVPVPATPEVAPRDTSLDYWRAQVRDVDSDALNLWCGRPDLAQPTLTGGQLSRLLSAQAREGIRRLEKRLRAPEAVIMLAAYGLLLARHGAGLAVPLADEPARPADLVIGTPVNVRPPDAPRAIGYHINTVPLRFQVDLEREFADLVARARGVFFEALARADVPVDHLLPEVSRVGGGWRTTLFRHMFNYVPAGGLQPFDLDGMRATPIGVENGASKFDLEFFILSTAEAVRVRAVYYAEVLDRDEVELMLERYDALLVALADDDGTAMGELDVFAPRDRAAIDAANDTAAPVELATVLEAVAVRVAAGPDLVACRDDERTVTRGQLWHAAERTRAALAGHGVSAGDVVALAAPRGPELAAAVLGVWLAGAAYLPLDPDHPAARIAYQLADAQARAVLVAPGVSLPDVPVLPMVACTDEAAVPRQAVLPAAAECAYLIYTSGSTGRPKGTRISHRSLGNLVQYFAGQLDAGPDDATLWLTTFAFDISALELFLPLVTGGRLVPAPDETRTDGAALAALVQRHGVTILQATPTSWRLIVDDLAGTLGGRRVLCGGEPLPAPLAARLAGTGCRLWNVYGPTETTIWSTSGEIGTPAPEVVDIGRPIANTEIFVADPYGRALPIGLRGELCIAGDGVALGYHERPELNARRFGDHPEYGRFYRTGDVARWRIDGTLEVLGRGDRQIKLRGNRIELSEVEAVLADHPEVKAASVVVAGDPGADGILVAFLESAAGPDLAEHAWRLAAERLPRSWMPQDVVVMDALPSNVNGKVDTLALTRLAQQGRVRGDVTAPASQEPADETIRLLLTLWRELLERADVTPDTHFFVSGGHSLLAAQLVQRIEGATGVRLKLADVFVNPSPAELAALLRGKK